jgi:hypothetical protein
MLEAAPLLAVTCGLIGIFMYYVLTLEIEDIRRNWDTRRCEPSSILFAQKIPLDPSVDKDLFAEDNFYFCLEKIIDSTLKRTLQPIFNIFTKQVDSIGPLQNAINALKSSASGYVNPLNALFNTMNSKFNTLAYESARISLRIKFAMQRINASIVASLFAGISMYQGIQNSIQYVIRVCLIILGILIALVFFLWFVMFPFIPTILAVISAISIVLGTAAVGGMASAFCVAPDTLVAMSDDRWVPVSEIKPGDILRGGSMVEGVLQTSALGAKCVSIDDVSISACHLVQYAGKWIPAEDHPAALPISQSFDSLYCLNTSNRTWIVKSSRGDLVLRDWEELPDSSVYDSIWESYIHTYLNSTSTPISDSESYPGRGLLHPDSLVFHKEKGYVSISTLSIGDYVKDSNNNFTKVIGVYTDISGPSQAVWVLHNSIWKHPSYIQPPSSIGYHLITESGTFFTSTYGLVRDFTEIGWNNIQDTYPLTSSILESLPTNF